MTLVLTKSSLVPWLVPEDSGKVPLPRSFHSVKLLLDSQSLDTRSDSTASVDTNDWQAPADSSTSQLQLQEFHPCTSSRAACGMCTQSRLASRSGNEMSFEERSFEEGQEFTVCAWASRKSPFSIARITSHLATRIARWALIRPSSSSNVMSANIPLSTQYFSRFCFMH